MTLKFNKPAVISGVNGKKVYGRDYKITIMMQEPTERQWQLIFTDLIQVLELK